MNEYTGMYLGIVIQNNDPDFRGRVKVYVPHIQANVYQDWFSELSDKSFRFLGKNIQSDLEKILPELKTVLPWAENSMPLIGASGSGKYNAHQQIGTISDSNRNETIQPHKHQTDVEKKYKLNDEHIGESPGKVYESHPTWVKDAFTNTDNPDDKEADLFAELEPGDRANGVNRPNKYAHNYRPNTYSNLAKGSFSIPNVGSHVWVFFQGGDHMQPVVFGVMHGEEDWKGIYDCNGEHGSDYPGTYENISKKEEKVFDNNTETYRNKYVINQKGGALEFVNTDNKEVLKMTHFSGSFIEFNNHTNIEFATRNSQRLIQEDYYDTVKGFRNIYTERDLDYIVRGDSYKKIGYQNYNYHLQWRDAMTPLAEVKALFEIQRISGTSWVNGVLSQKLKGTPLPCPVCNDTGRIKYWSLRNVFKYTGITDTSWGGGNGASSAETGNNQQGFFNPLNRSDLGVEITNAIQYVFKNEGYQSAQEHGGSSGVVFGEKCPVCAGRGTSPSTMEGTWELEERKSDKNFEETLKRVTENLAPIESELGLGGSEIINVSKHKIENIGMVMNNFPSIRTDPVGKMYRDSMIIHKEGVLASQKPSPLIEPVHVDDLPGGSYSLNITNRWNVHVGAGGIAIKTLGRVEIGGTQVSIAGDQVNIGSQNEVNIDGGKRLNIVSDIISIRQRDRGQVMVDSNLGVTQNVIVGGGLHVEGELTCQHITAPVEIHETELVKLYSKLLTGLSFTANFHGGTHVDAANSSDNHHHWTGAEVTLITDSNDDHVVAKDHSHLFKNAAMTLKETNDGVRVTGQECNDTNGATRAKASDVEVIPASQKVKA